MKKKTMNSTIGIVLIVVILVLVNLIANTKFARLDLTEDKLYSLSNASKEVVRGIEEPVTIKVFASKNLSPRLNDTKRFLNDILSGYKAYGSNNFRYEFVDPGSDEKLEKEAQDYKIPPFQENVWNKDKLELKKVYLGLVILYGEKQEVIPTLQSTSGLEYSITSMLKRITSQQDLEVAFLFGHGEPHYQETIAQATNILLSNCKVSGVDLADGKEIPENVDILLIVKPTQPFSEVDKLKVDQFVMKGGKLAWMYSPVNTDIQQGMANDVQLGLDDWTSNYGFRVNSDLVADMNSSMVSIQERRGFFTVQNTVNYPFFPNITEFDANSEVANSLEMVSLFFPSSIDTSYARNANINLTPMFYTGEYSMSQVGRYDISANKTLNKAIFNRSNMVLGAQLEGTFKSFFADRDFPTPEDGETTIQEADLITESAPDSRMIVIGDGNFIQDEYLRNPSNLFLLLNAVDWLAGETDLIKLRTREVAVRPLKEISDSQKKLWKYVNWFGPSLIAIILGLVYWQVRKNRRYGEI
jgi:gliding motility-associatede transport system auxiliary component